MPKEQETGSQEPEFDMTDSGFYDPLLVMDDDSEQDTDSQTAKSEEGEKDPPETGSESPEDAIKASNKGQEGESEDGQGDLSSIRAFMEKHGFKSVEALEENYADKQRKANEDAHNMNVLMAKLEALEQKISTRAEEPQEETPQLTDAELTDILTENPSKFMKILSDQVLNSLAKSGPLSDLSKTVKQLQEGFQTSQGANVLRDMRSDYADFKDFESQIETQLEALGSSLKGMNSRAVLEHLYKSAKQEAFIRDLMDKTKKVKDGNEQVEEQAQRTSKIAKGGDKTGPGEKSETEKKDEVVKTPVGKLKREDLDLIHDPTMLTIGNVPPGIKVGVG